MAKSKVWKVHPLCRAFHKDQFAMPKDQLASLTEDIRQNGIKVPILVNKKRDTILDGLNRWNISQDLKIKIPEEGFEIFTGAPAEEEKEILSRNVFRRHMNDDQRAMMVSKVLGPSLEKKAKERQSAAGSFKGKTKMKGKSVAQEIHEKTGIGKSKIEQAEKIRRSGKEELVEDVISKKTKLHKAAKAAGSRRKPAKAKKEVPFEDVVYKKWTAWLNKFEHEQRREVMKLVKGWIG